MFVYFFTLILNIKISIFYNKYSGFEIMFLIISIIRGLINDILIYFSMLILGIIGLPFSLISEWCAYKFIKIYCLTCFFILRVIANIRVECRGEIPQNNVLICAKHMSFLDILMLAYYLPKFSFVMKKEIVFTPIIGIYALRVGCVPVKRGNRSKALNKMVSDYNPHLYNNDDKQIVIYPQGTRVLPNQKKDYKIGAGVLYGKFNLPCYLVGTNTGLFWPKGSWIRKPGTAIIEFCEVVQPGMSINKFMEKIEYDIENCSNKLMRNH